MTKLDLVDINDVKALEVYALNNYDVGGHWVYETYGSEDYAELLLVNDHDIDKAKDYLRYHWEWKQDIYEDVSATAF
jgi:hypothetical protein